MPDASDSFTSPDPVASPGCLMPIVWLIAGGLMVLLSALALVAAASGSESDGVSAAWIAAGPIGFGCAGIVSAVVTHFMARSAGARIGAPLGCGCVGAIAAVIATGVFFAVIFPAL